MIIINNEKRKLFIFLIMKNCSKNRLKAKYI